MVPGEENQLVPKEIENAAEEPRVLCIIQDTTNSKAVSERITLNLPASTPVRKLFEDVANKVGYINGTFDLTWGNGVNTADTAPLDHTSDKSLLDANFEPGKKNFLHLTDKDGEQPQMLLVSYLERHNFCPLGMQFSEGSRDIQLGDNDSCM